MYHSYHWFPNFYQHSQRDIPNNLYSGQNLSTTQFYRLDRVSNFNFSNGMNPFYSTGFYHEPAVFSGLPHSQGQGMVNLHGIPLDLSPMNFFLPKLNNEYEYGIIPNELNVYGLKKDQELNLMSIFDDPLHPIHDDNQSNNLYYNGMQPYADYFIPPKPIGGGNYFLDSFKDQKGNLDINKMVATAGQVMGIANQVSGLLKGITSIFKA